MKNVIRLRTRLLTTMLLATLLASCGSATTPASNGPASTAQQAAGLDQTPSSAAAATTTGIATSVQLTQTMASTDESAPTQRPAPTSSPVAPPTATVPAPGATEQANQPVPGAIAQADIKLFQYQPDPLAITTGTEVVWTNQDAEPHTVTHGTYVKRGGDFDSGTLQQGQSFAFTFNRAGTYPYTCLIHPEMVGTVTVVEP